ncbi:MAG: pyridoxal-phosphate dependent enzyme [Hyphomicrobiales bacterium]|nr:pyridoxal-phosphate dependent enzyme [Hyphomicrobiales bacterium]
MTIELIANPLRGKGLAQLDGLAAGEVETDARAAIALYQHCPIKQQTPVESQPQLAQIANVGEVWLKLESERMGLGSFKALGAAYAIAKEAAKRVDASDAQAMSKALEGEVFICASAGNHGLSVAAGARLFGARAVVLLADTVPESFADRLREKGADVVRAGADYEASMAASKTMAEENGWQLLSDGSWLGYSDPPRDVMEGYLIMGHEVADQLERTPTHVFLQAGVGGLAAGCAATARDRWGEDVTLIVVEPSAAPALIESVKAGQCVDTSGPVSSMGRLDCKTPSHLALKYLAREADHFLTIDDQSVEQVVEQLGDHDVPTSPSGAAGLAALLNLSDADQQRMGLTPASRVLCYISEGPA